MCWAAVGIFKKYKNRKDGIGSIISMQYEMSEEVFHRKGVLL